MWWWRILKIGGEGGAINELAAEKINASSVSRLLRLTLLAPDMVKAILDGRQPEGITLPGLMDGVEVGWCTTSPAPSPPATMINR